MFPASFSGFSSSRHILSPGLLALCLATAPLTQPTLWTPSVRAVSGSIRALSGRCAFADAFSSTWGAFPLAYVLPHPVSGVLLFLLQVSDFSCSGTLGDLSLMPPSSVLWLPFRESGSVSGSVICQTLHYGGLMATHTQACVAFTVGAVSLSSKQDGPGLRGRGKPFFPELGS